jgi:ATP-dependent DNA ligase/DNA-binding PadR family transcriptional regulator
MGYHQLGDSDNAKRTGERRRMALELLLVRPHSATELAEIWDVHPNSAYKVLLRLQKKGSVERGEGNLPVCKFSITATGLRKLKFLQERSMASEAQESSLGDLFETYPSIDGVDGPVDGPVSLMRIPEIDDVGELPSGIEWLTEKKMDGWLVSAVGGRLYSRRGKDITGHLPPVAKAIAGYKHAYIIGELIYWTPQGKTDESTVTSVAGTRDPQDAAAKLAKLPGFFQLVAFDLIADGGRDISQQGFEKRRQALEGLIRTGKHLALSSVYPLAEWQKAYDQALAEGGEGVVFKNAAAPYFWRPLGEREEKRAKIQYKLKELRSDDFIVFFGYVTDKDSLIVRFGQLWRGEIIEVGEVNNFSAGLEKELAKLLREGPFVMEIAYQERFPKPPGKLRHPRFVRLRLDKPIESVTLPEKYAP